MRDTPIARTVSMKLVAENPEAIRDFIASVTPTPDPLDLEAVTELWVRVSLGYEDAAKEAGPLAIKHVGGLLAMVHELKEANARLAEALDAAHQQGFRP